MPQRTAVTRPDEIVRARAGLAGGAFAGLAGTRAASRETQSSRPARATLAPVGGDSLCEVQMVGSRWCRLRNCQKMSNVHLIQKRSRPQGARPRTERVADQTSFCLRRRLQCRVGQSTGNRSSVTRTLEEPDQTQQPAFAIEHSAELARSAANLLPSSTERS